MSAILNTVAEERECASGTLGDLVYSNKAKARIPETDWRAILQSIGAGDRLALRALYDRTHRIVFTLAMRVIDNQESAEEVTLEVFHEVWRQAATYDRVVGSVIGWLSSLARSKAVDRLRLQESKASGVAPGTSLPQRSQIPATAAGHRAERLEHKVQAKALQDALTSLATEERQTIESALFSESTYAEVASRPCQTPGAVKTSIHCGLARLRMALAKQDKTS